MNDCLGNNIQVGDYVCFTTNISAHVESCATVGRVIKNTPKGVRVHYIRRRDIWDSSTKVYSKQIQRFDTFKLINKVVKVDPPEVIKGWLASSIDISNNAILKHWLETGELLT